MGQGGGSWGLIPRYEWGISADDGKVGTTLWSACYWVCILKSSGGSRLRLTRKMWRVKWASKAREAVKTEPSWTILKEMTCRGTQLSVIGNLKVTYENHLIRKSVYVLEHQGMKFKKKYPSNLSYKKRLTWLHVKIQMIFKTIWHYKVKHSHTQWLSISIYSVNLGEILAHRYQQIHTVYL